MKMTASTLFMSGKFQRCANRSNFLRSSAYGLSCAHGLAAIASVADCRDDRRIVPLEQFAPEEILVREKHGLRLRFSSVKDPKELTTRPNDSVQGEKRPAPDSGGEESVKPRLQACFASRITIVRKYSHVESQSSYAIC
jgi:hypothetical protein